MFPYSVRLLTSYHTFWLVPKKTNWDGDERHYAFFSSHNRDQKVVFLDPVSHEILNRNPLLKFNSILSQLTLSFIIFLSWIIMCVIFSC